MVLAYVVPFLAYVIPTQLESIHLPGLTYEVVCTLKGIAAAGALWIYRRYYPSFTANGMVLAVLYGVVGFILWIFLDQIQSHFSGLQTILSWLQPGGRVGYDPFQGETNAAIVAFVGIRILELAIIVPLIEEIFWRGFLSRYLLAEDFENVAPGTFTSFSLAVVTLAFASVHPEFLASIAWCLLANLLYWQTSNLWACVVMHSITNAVLGVYILSSRSWHLW